MRSWQQQQNLLLGIFILLSLFLHLFLGHYLPLQRLLEPPQRPPEPLVVQMLPDKPAPPRPDKPRELDLPETEPQQRETPAKRLGPQDHVAKEETAPKGKDFEDRKPVIPKRGLPVPSRKLPSVHGGPAVLSPLKPSDAPVPAPSIPLDSLLRLPQATIDRNAQEARRKEREGVKDGDVVWLDTEKDILASFFRRFRNNIYRVWGYPASAVQQGDQGVTRLQITVTRQGVVKKVDILNGSGSDSLDREAVKAVRMGSPYGTLPQEYKGETLQIVADFHYVLSGRPTLGRWGYRQSI